jgi:hypothetical protein
MEAVSTSETSVNFYETTRCNIPEDSHIHTHCRENLKSQTEDYLPISFFLVTFHNLSLFWPFSKNLETNYVTTTTCCLSLEHETFIVIAFRYLVLNRYNKISGLWKASHCAIHFTGRLWSALQIVNAVPAFSLLERSYCSVRALFIFKYVL